MIVCIHYLTSVKDDSDSGKVVYYNCCFIHGCGGEIDVLKKWSSNDSGGLGFLRHNARAYVKSRDTTLHFNGKLLSVSVLV